MKIERQKTVTFEHESEYADIGTIRLKVVLLRKTAEIETKIAQAKAQLLGGFQAASVPDDLWITAVASLANAVEPVDIKDANWIENTLVTREAVFALYNEWHQYNVSFRKQAVAEAKTDAKGSEQAPVR